MRAIITVLILGAFAGGCSTVREKSFIDLLHGTMIPEINFLQLPLEDALKDIQAMWNLQTGSNMPAIEIRCLAGDGFLTPKASEPWPSRTITFSARNISFYDAYQIIGAVNDCDFYVFGVQEAGSPFPWVYIGNCENTSMQWRLDAITKTVLDLGDKPDDKDIRKALELRGVDCSRGDIRIFVANNEDIWIGGAKEKVALAKAIFELSQKGYQVKRREKSQQ